MFVVWKLLQRLLTISTSCNISKYLASVIVVLRWLTECFLAVDKNFVESRINLPLEIFLRPVLVKSYNPKTFVSSTLTFVSSTLNRADMSQTRRSKRSHYMQYEILSSDTKALVCIHFTFLRKVSAG